ncbi:hypothetical protein ARAM_001721 [Aspergillus rambellii]|uniref:Carboxylesterase type B domain-containing protein n=1 Tax=Aspergillus rambellii TaxID=308745 RepID=A0A0F8U1T3_9EURO|nr:hypothetical protein ARAM_001721 [Aspergillus rambellii]
MPNKKFAILLLAATCARTATSPRSLRSDISILITNDLLESESPYSGSGVLLLDAMDLDSAAESCKALGETLWKPETPFSVIKPHLDYLIYQGRYSAEQRFWISSGVQHRRPQTITRTGLILPAADRERLPVLCTQSAPYSNETFSDTSSDFQVTIYSNKEHITGYRDRHAFRFLGIRYADEPERWTYSKLYQGSGSSVSALQFGNSCLQGPTTGAEDCLFLNIWTPYLPNQRGRSNLGSSLRPVLFWIHGGAFMSGKGSDPYTDGSNLASRGDVVVVAINYRLGSLGFLALHDGQTNGNFGLATKSQR